MSSFIKRYGILSLSCLTIFLHSSIARTLTPLELQRQRYLRECDLKLDDWRQKNGILKRRLKIHPPDTVRYHSLEESINIIAVNIGLARMEIKKLKQLRDDSAWSHGHSELESRFRAIDSIYSHAQAE